MNSLNLKQQIGFDPESCESITPNEKLIEFINLNLAALGQPIYGNHDDYPSLEMGRGLISHYQAKDQLLDEEVHSPVDKRIEAFLDRYLVDVDTGKRHSLPGNTFTLGQHGIARLLSIPPSQDSYKSDLVESFRVANGVLHNPVNDRRTTKGVFHVSEGGLPIPNDKKAVPKVTFAKLFQSAMCPPDSLMELPFTAAQDDKAKVWVSLMLRPTVCPEVKGFILKKSMEVRFFAPGSLVSNLDFVESIFGNGGDPFLVENDAALDVKHWSGHTGCVILAPHLKTLKKKDLGLPHIKDATERQKRDGMCWENEDELYNDGGAFKITARDETGTVVTLIADNYFGYCKKEVKTQIGFAANLFGLTEEEHAGGTLAFVAFDLGESFKLSDHIDETDHSFDKVLEHFGGRIDMKPEGYGIDKNFPSIYYVPEGANFSLREQSITWEKNGEEVSIKLLAEVVYVLPYGYKVQIKKPAEGRRWRLIGTMPEPIFCHKPCTVSGGGKSEISKSIADAIIHAPFYVKNLKEDLDAVEEVLNGTYANRYKDASRNRKNSRKILSPERSLGSVIKLLTPSPAFTDEHNAWIEKVPTHIKELTLLLKRFYKPAWGENWKERFSVDIINGQPGHELKYRDSKVTTSYLRVGYEEDGSWRVFSLRKDFHPATKIQMEDDISASVTVPADKLANSVRVAGAVSGKIVQNCEYRLFQRPDDAIIRGYDNKTEEDLSRKNNFLSNYHALTREEAKEMMQDPVRFDYFTKPMKALITDFVLNPESNPDFLVCSANPRIVDGVPTKNPRYLQNRLGLESPIDDYLCDIGIRLNRQLKEDDSAPIPVTSVLPGRRNNPPEKGIRPLANFNPIHYLPLPEAFMEFITSMTGKSPSTTGAGSEGALTKAPFNALLPITDMNNALISFALNGSHAFITAAGYVGPKFRVDHDISLLVPEIWSRMTDKERDPNWLIENGLLEKVPNLDFEGKELPVSILGYRINSLFINHFLGRIFTSPEMLFTEEMLKPELQGLDVFADGLENMMVTHKLVAANYFADGSIDKACPPLKALLHIMKDGNWEGKTMQDSEFRTLFDPESMISSDWYQERLNSRQESDLIRWNKILSYLKKYKNPLPDLDQRIKDATEHIQLIESQGYIDSLKYTLGRDPSIGVG